MVPIGDVEGRKLRKRRDQRVAIRSGYRPQRVFDAIDRLKIDEWRRGDDPGGDRIDGRRRLVDQEHRAGLGMHRLDVAGAIVFLVAPRPFVLLDHVGIVFRDREAARQPELLVRAHPETVEVDARLVLEHQ
jgi:hypothetical protein